ncbi:MAG: polymorphic toxin type 23 domain-containing protein [Bacteroidota bacterium]
MVRRRLLSYLLLLLLFPLAHSSSAQTEQWDLEVRLGANINLNFSLGEKQKFPGVRVFASGIVNRNFFNAHWIFNYGATVALYTRSLGNDLNPLSSDFQFDFTNSISLGGAWGGDSLSYTKYLRTINSAPFYNLKHNRRNAIYLSTIFILNNHRRNQTIGSASMSFGDFSFTYYNDGGPFFGDVGIADSFDRWWTGGLCLFFHNNKSYNVAEFSFDQFTGYSPLIYELTSIFGMNVPRYNFNDGNGPYSPISFNSAAYNLKIFLDDNNAIDLGMIGSLKFPTKHQEEVYRHYSLQDMLHIARGSALHPNKDINRIFFGVTSHQSVHQQILE